VHLSIFKSNVSNNDKTTMASLRPTCTYCLKNACKMGDKCTKSHEAPQDRLQLDRLQLEASIEADPDWKLAFRVRSAPKELRSDKGLMIKAVKKNGDIFEVLPATLRGDEDVARVVLEETTFHRMLRFTSPELQANKAFVIDVVQKWGRSLQWASNELRDDDEVVIAAVKQDPHAISWASQRLLADKEMLMLAFTQMKPADTESLKADAESLGLLKLVSLGLKADKEVVLLAMAHYGRALQWASQQLRKDKEVALAAVKQDPFALNWASESLRNDKELVIAAIKSRGGCSNSVPDFILREWFSDRDVVVLAVTKDGSLLQHACPELKADRDLVFTAVQKTPTALQWASRELKTDKQLVLLAALRNRPILMCTSLNIRTWATIIVDMIPAELRALATRVIARHDFPAYWFRSTIIYAIQGTRSHSCTLKKIRQGHETNTAIIKCIAKFIGVRCPHIMEANIELCRRLITVASS
jgi:hypothetical protein